MPTIPTRINLSKFGWTGKTIPTNLDDIFMNLPTWRDLHILRPMGPHKYRFPWQCFQDDSNKFMPAIQIGAKIDSGSYGSICMAKRAIFKPQFAVQPDCVGTPQTHFQKEGSSEEIVCKILPIVLSEAEKRTSRLVQEAAHEEEIQAILYEAALHIVVNHFFQAFGYPSAVPTLHEVVALSEKRVPQSPMDISGVILNMEFIEGWTVYDYLKTYFASPRSQEEVEKLLLDILVQLATFLDILQIHLRFNHRDLKINNVLFRKHLCLPTINHPSLKKPWNCKHNVAIIDFGFSCIACDEPSRRSLIQAGSWFSQRHDCMKKGRDIALFLYSWQTFFPLEGSVSNAFYKMLDDCMTATQVAEGGTTVRLWNGINEKGIPYTQPRTLEFHDGVYKFLRFSDVEIPGCEPQNLLPVLEAYAMRRQTGDKN